MTSNITQENFSIIIPCYNEKENIFDLIKEIDLYLKDYKNFEIIIVDDGSKDNLKEIYPKILDINNLTRIISHKKNFGQSKAIYTGIRESTYNVIVTIDADGQNNPADIPKLLDIFFQNGDISLVGGLRLKRKDNIVKRLSSILANKLRSAILNDNCVDTGCSLKVFEKDIFLNFPFFDGIHRFLPALFIGFGKKTLYEEVNHRPRKLGMSKYGTFDRLVKGIRDLIKVRRIIKKMNIND